MNENAKILIDALRSGEYEQARGELRYDDKYCCLGVACDIYHNHHPNICQWEQSEFFSMFTQGNAGTYSVSLPNAVNEWFGLGHDLEKDLVNRNDGRCGFDQHNFEEIADFLEEVIYESTDPVMA